MDDEVTKRFSAEELESWILPLGICICCCCHLSTPPWLLELQDALTPGFSFEKGLWDQINLVFSRCCHCKSAEACFISIRSEGLHSCYDDEGFHISQLLVGQ